ncbi:hypothetical protein AVEN_170391-1, partial [Araneus ventricosus]
MRYTRDEREKNAGDLSHNAQFSKSYIRGMLHMMSGQEQLFQHIRTSSEDCKIYHYGHVHGVGDRGGESDTLAQQACLYPN